jgi:hypothetical protein
MRHPGIKEMTRLLIIEKSLVVSFLAVHAVGFEPDIDIV